VSENLLVRHPRQRGRRRRDPEDEQERRPQRERDHRRREHDVPPAAAGSISSPSESRVRRALEGQAVNDASLAIAIARYFTRRSRMRGRSESVVERVERALPVAHLQELHARGS
jgi:hypothetical protein